MAGADEVSFLAVTLGNATDESFLLAITRRKTTGTISPSGAIRKIITAGHIKPSFFDVQLCALHLFYSTRYALEIGAVLVRLDWLVLF